MWWIPTGKYGLFGEPIYETKILPNFAPKAGKYCCKECKAMQKLAYGDASRKDRI